MNQLQDNAKVNNMIPKNKQLEDKVDRRWINTVVAFDSLPRVKRSNVCKLTKQRGGGWVEKVR